MCEERRLAEEGIRESAGIRSGKAGVLCHQKGVAVPLQVQRELTEEEHELVYILKTFL